MELLVVAPAERNDADSREPLLQLLEHLDAVHARHPEVEQHDVRRDIARECQRLVP